MIVQLSGLHYARSGNAYYYSCTSITFTRTTILLCRGKEQFRRQIFASLCVLIRAGGANNPCYGMIHTARSTANAAAFSSFAIARTATHIASATSGPPRCLSCNRFMNRITLLYRCPLSRRLQLLEVARLRLSCNCCDSPQSHRMQSESWTPVHQRAHKALTYVQPFRHQKEHTVCSRNNKHSSKFYPIYAPFPSAIPIL
jgi:hypothetical protein